MSVQEKRGGRVKSNDLHKFSYKYLDFSLSNGSHYLVSLAGKELGFTEDENNFQ